MVLIASSHDQEDSYRVYPVDQEQCPNTQFQYPAAVPLYFSSQNSTAKLSMPGYPHPTLATVSGYEYSNWHSIQEDSAACFFENQISQETYFPAYPIVPNLDACMASYPMPMYDLGLPLTNNDTMPLDVYHASPIYVSPSGTPSSDLWYQDPDRIDFSHYCQIPDSMSSSPSDESMSPRSTQESWLTTTSTNIRYPSDEEGEQLQGLGLYDCPDLTMDDFEGATDPKRFSLGKGLKLEESFELEEAEEEEEEQEEEEEEGEQEYTEGFDEWESSPQPISQMTYGPVPWP